MKGLIPLFPTLIYRDPALVSNYDLVQREVKSCLDKILNEDDTGHGILLNAAEEAYFLSAINETAGSDGAVHVEIVAQGNSI